MNVVVFGGSGFIGSHTSDVLSERGHNVTIFDTIRSPYLQKNQEMIIGNILDKETVRDVISGNNIVYNFVSVSEINDSNKNPLKSIELNILGNVNVLEGCKKENVERYIFASSVYVYNSMSSFYGTTKKACEMIIENYWKEYHVPYTILRYGSLYGPRAQNWNGIHNVIKQAIKTKKIYFEGTGEETRELIHVKDAAEMNVNILDKKYENTHLVLTGTEKIKWKNLIQTINEIIGGNIEVTYGMKTDNHYLSTPYEFKPDTAKKMTTPEYYDLGQGLLDCIYEVSERKKIIFFDFDGTLVESADIKTEAFRELFSPFGKEIQDKVVKHHIENGGIPRSIKLKHYYTKFVGKEIKEDELTKLEKMFSDMVVEKIIKSKFVEGAIEFLKRNYEDMDLYVVSGTPQKELEFIIKEKKIIKYFMGIYGHPFSKDEVIKKLLQKYDKKKALFIGDSMSDFRAAKETGIEFIGKKGCPFPEKTETFDNFNEVSI